MSSHLFLYFAFFFLLFVIEQFDQFWLRYLFYSLTQTNNMRQISEQHLIRFFPSFCICALHQLQLHSSPSILFFQPTNQSFPLPIKISTSDLFCSLGFAFYNVYHSVHHFDVTRIWPRKNYIGLITLPIKAALAVGKKS